MIVGMIPMGAFADETARIYFETSVEDASALKIGDTFTVTAYLENNPGFSALQWELTWANDVVRFDGYTTYEEDGEEYLDSSVAKATYAPVYNQETSTIVVGVESNKTPNGKICVANFTILKDGDAEIGLKTDWPNFELKKTDQSDVPVTIDQTALEGLTITHECSHVETVVPPTCTTGGYTEYKCSCGDTYTSNNTPATGHSYVDGVCDLCGAEGTAIPEGAKFTDMLTDEGNTVTITEMDGFYKVEVPYGTSTLYVTYPEDVPYVDSFGYVKTRMSGFDGVSEDGYGKTQKDGKISVGLALEKAPANGAPTVMRLINLDDQYGKKVTICMADGSEETFALTYKLGNGQYFAVLPMPEDCVGYTITGKPIASDGYTFNVSILEGYEATENFAVKVNGETVATEPGDISIPSVTEDIKITVVGVEKIVENTDISVTFDLTDYTGDINASMSYITQGYQNNEVIPEAGKKTTLSLAAADNMIFEVGAYDFSPMITHWEINGERYAADADQTIGNWNTEYIYISNSYFTMHIKTQTPVSYVIKAIVETDHTHTYDRTVADGKFLKAEATCQSAAEYYKSCKCGEFAETAETFFDGEPVLCSYEDGVCKWCGTAEPEPVETTSFFTVTLNDEDKTPVTIYQQGEVYCDEYGDAVPKLIAYVPEGTKSVILSNDSGLHILPDESEYLGCLVNPVIELTGEYTFYGIFPSDWSDVCHLYIEEGEIAHVCEYEAVVTPPTCTEGGYTTYTCSCGDSYIGQRVSATGHTNVNGTCSTCGAPLTVIPEGAPFLDMMTSDGKPVTVTDLGTDPFYGMGKLYKVEVPVGTIQVNITLNQSKVYVDEFGYAKTMMQGFDNVTEDGYGQTTKDGKVTVGLQMEKAPANGSSSTIRLLNVPYPEDVYEVKAVGLINAAYDGLDFYAFTYMLAEGQYYANLPDSFMYTVTGDGVASNGYKFNVSINNGYEATEDFAVRVNGEIVATQPGEVTVASVTEDLTITVEGVNKIYNPETDVSITVDLTEYTGEIEGQLWFNKKSGPSYTAYLVPGKNNTIILEASDLWQMFATISSIGSDVIGYDINGEIRDPGYLSFGFNVRDNAQPGKYVIKPVVGSTEPEQPAPNPITKIELSHPAIETDDAGKMSMTVYPGTTRTLDLSFSVENAELEATQIVFWSSDNEAVATVDQNGTVTPVSAGTAVITAKAVEASGVAAAAEDDEVLTQVTVTVPDVDNVEEQKFTVALPGDQAVTVGESVAIPVTVGHTGEAAIFNSYDITLTYDDSLLQLTSTGIKGATVTAEGNTINVKRYGADLAVDSAAFTLTFQALDSGTAKAQVTEAYVSESETALDKDADAALILNDLTVIRITGYTVTLPGEFKGDASVDSGEDYTFEAKDKNYNYDVTAKIGETEVTVTDNGDGTFTIAAKDITGNIVITTEKTGK